MTKKIELPDFVRNPITKHEKYYEAVIQLRNPNSGVIGLINNQLKHRKDVFISEILPEKNGCDIYISDQRFARSLGTKLHRSFRNSTHKTSRKIFTRDRQSHKDVYRVTVFFCLTKDQEC